MARKVSGWRNLRIKYGVLSAAAIVATSQFAGAASENYTWSAATGGSWDFVSLNWDNTTTATLGVAWANNGTLATPNTATFGPSVGPFTVTVNDVINVGALNFNLDGWDIAAGTGTLSYGTVGTIAVNTNGFSNTIGASIINTGANATGVTYSGGGTTTVDGTNTYTGVTTIGSGSVVAVSSEANLGAGSGAGNVVIAGTLRANGTFTLGATRGVTLGNGAFAPGTIQVGTLSAYYVPAGGPTLTIAGVIANSGGFNNLIKTGDGNLVLANANTYSGSTSTTLSSGFYKNITGTGVVGAIIVAANGALGTADGTASTGTIVGNGANNGVLAFQGGVNYTANELVTIQTGGWTTGSIRSISGDNTFAGNMIMQDGVGFATSNIVTFATDAGSSLSLTGVVSDDGQTHLIKLGTGTLAFKNAMTYAGRTNVAWAGSGSANSPPLNANNVNGGSGLFFPAGTLTLGRSATGVFGSVLNSPIVNIGDTGTLLIDNTTKTGGDAVSVARMGASNILVLGDTGRLRVDGTAAANTVDTLGSLRTGGNYYFANPGVRSLGQVYIDVNPGAGKTSTLEFAHARTAGSVALFTGPNFGQATGSNVAQVLITGGIETLGSYAGNAFHNITGLGSTAAKTVDTWFVHDTISGVTSMATYDTNGVRPLSDATETETNFALASGLNFRAGPGITTASSQTIQSLTMRGNGVTIDGTGTLTIFSDYGHVGTLLSTGTGNVINGPVVRFANPNYAFEHGVIYVEGDLTIASQLGDAAFVTTAYGITKAGPGELILTNTNNQLGGTTNLNYNYLQAGKLTLSSPFNLMGVSDTSAALGIYSGSTLKITGGGIVDFSPSNTLNGNTTNGVELHFASATKSAGGQNPETTFVEVTTGTTFRVGFANVGGNGQVNGFTKIGGGTLYVTTDMSHDAIDTMFLKEGTLTLGDTSYSTGVAPSLASDFGTFARYGRVVTSPGTTIRIDSQNMLPGLGEYGGPIRRLGGVEYNGTSVILTGNPSVNTSDRFQETQHFDSGASTITIIPGAGRTSQLRGGYWTRDPGATTEYVGTNVGAAVGANVSHFTYAAYSSPNLGTTAAGAEYWAVVISNGGAPVLAVYDAGIATLSGYGSVRALTTSEMTAGNAITGGQNVLLTASQPTGSVSVATLTLRNTGTTTNVANSGTLGIYNHAILSTGTVANSITGGTLDFNGEAVVHAYNTLNITSDITGSGGFTKAGTGTVVHTGANSYSGNTWVNTGSFVTTNLINGSDTIVHSGASVQANRIVQNSLSLLGTAQGKVAASGTPNTNTNVVSTLTLGGTTDAWTAKLDLGNNSLIVSNGGTAAAGQTVTKRTANQIKQGLDINGTLWNGNGITSSTAAADANTTLALGIIQNNDGGVGVGDGTTGSGGSAIYATFGGQSVNVNDTLVKFTWFGDADLSGVIDDTDYFLINNGFAVGASGWLNGDFDYSGVIDDTDYFLINNAFALQSGPLSANLAVAVPEPTSLALLGMGAVGLLSRRRRK